MNTLFRLRDSKQCRFQMPNDVWKWELKPQGFAILAYLCYLHTHCKNFAVPGADEIAVQLHMSVDMAMEQRIGNRIVVPKEPFIQWVDAHTGGNG